MAVQHQCEFCNQKVSLTSRGEYAEYLNEITLETGGGGELAIGVDSKGRVVMRALFDDYTRDYYPKYCPECGRKLNNKEDNK